MIYNTFRDKLFDHTQEQYDQFKKVMINNPGISFQDKDGILWIYKDSRMVGKPSMRDPNVKGFTYIWKPDIVEIYMNL